MWHEDVFYKLQTVRQILWDHGFLVRIDHANPSLYSERGITAGVTEASPILLSVFVSDMPRMGKVKVSLCADDTATFVTDHNANYAALRLQLDAYFEWADNWKVDISASTA